MKIEQIASNYALPVSRSSCYVAALYLAGRKVTQASAALSLTAAIQVHDKFQTHYKKSESFTENQKWLNTNQQRFAALAKQNVKRDLITITALIAIGLALELTEDYFTAVNANNEADSSAFAKAISGDISDPLFKMIHNLESGFQQTWKSTRHAYSSLRYATMGEERYPIERAKDMIIGMPKSMQNLSSQMMEIVRDFRLTKPASNIGEYMGQCGPVCQTNVSQAANKALELVNNAWSSTKNAAAEFFN